MLTRSPLFTRTMATATKGKEILPLKGVKVLDMTRVLAGVSTYPFFVSFLSFRMGEGEVMRG